MTPFAQKILEQIGTDGCLASDVDPDWDDDTAEALIELTEAGLIYSTPARFDDYFQLTDAGRSALLANAQGGDQ